MFLAPQRQLQRRGAHDLAVDALTRFPDDQEIHVAASRAIVALGRMDSGCPSGDGEGVSSILVQLLGGANERFASSSETVTEIGIAIQRLSQA